MAEEKADLDPQKLRRLLSYLADHNHHHVEELVQWAERIEAAGRGEVTTELRKAVELYERMGDHFRAAAEKL